MGFYTEGPIFREGVNTRVDLYSEVSGISIVFRCCNQTITNLFIYSVYKKENPTLACYNVFNFNTVELVLLNGHVWNLTNVSASNKCLLNRGYNNSV